jgi:hypothetical protein
MFSLQQNWRIKEQNRFCLEVGMGRLGVDGERGGPNKTMYTCILMLVNVKMTKNVYKWQTGKQSSILDNVTATETVFNTGEILKT